MAIGSIQDCRDKKNVFIITILTILLIPEAIEATGVNKSIAIPSTPMRNTPTDK